MHTPISMHLFFLGIIRYIFYDVRYIAGKDFAKIMDCCHCDIAILLQGVKRSAAERIIVDQFVRGDATLFHRDPKRCIRNQRNQSFFFIVHSADCIDYSRYIGYTI